MILHISYHKEERDFSVRPVTGTYSDINFYVKITELKYSPYANGDYKNYHFAAIVDNAREVAEKINSTANTMLAIVGEGTNEIRFSRNLFPKVLAQMPTNFPKYYPSNPERLVEIMKL